MQRRRLLVIRHAKAGQDGATDAERPLTDRGVRDAEELGEWLAGQELSVDHALVSSALRAVQTWEAVARGAGWQGEPETSRSLYAAEPETALDLLREVTGAATVALVGHNPTVGTMAQLLDDGDGDVEAGNALAVSGYPPGAVAVFDVDGEWADLGWGGARLAAYRDGR